MTGEPHPTLAREGDVFVLDLGAGENTIGPAWIAAVGELLDQVAGTPAPRALVTKATGKFFSSGLDLAWIGARPDEVPQMLRDLHELLARLLELPVPTVAAVQGHAFAGGAIVALAHDVRVMRADRGWICLPEVDGRIAFTPGLADLLAARMGPLAAHEAMTSGRRYTGEEAHAAGFVEHVVAEEELLPRALAVAQALAPKDPATLGAIKAQLQRRVLASLRDAEANRAGHAAFAWAVAAQSG